MAMTHEDGCCDIGGPKAASDAPHRMAPMAKGAMMMDPTGGPDGNYQNKKQAVSRESHPLPASYVTPPPAKHGVVKSTGPIPPGAGSSTPS